MDITCKACGKAFNTDTISMREECPHCGCDIHACIYCKFYNRRAYNECSEPQAERVVDKSRQNMCDYFSFFSNDSGAKGFNKKDYLKELDNLFK